MHSLRIVGISKLSKILTIASLALLFCTPHYAKASATKSTTEYQQILGVSESATHAEITKAYRRLAMKLHPDRTGGDMQKEEQFKLAKDAYEYLIAQTPKEPTLNSSGNKANEEYIRRSQQSRTNQQSTTFKNSDYAQQAHPSNVSEGLMSEILNSGTSNIDNTLEDKIVIGILFLEQHAPLSGRISLAEISKSAAALMDVWQRVGGYSKYNGGNLDVMEAAYKACFYHLNALSSKYPDSFKTYYELGFNVLFKRYQELLQIADPLNLERRKRIFETLKFANQSRPEASSCTDLFTN